MSALPDLRLQATPEAKSKAKQPAKAPEPSKKEASSFAEVYAKERQAKPGERSGSTAKSSQEQPAKPGAEASTPAATAAEQPVVAAPGNSLPAEEGTQEALDPLLAMALGGMPLPADMVPAAEEALPPEALLITGFVGGSAEETQPVLEPEVDDPLAMLAELPEEEVKTQPVQEALSRSARISTSTDFAAAMAAMGKGEETLKKSDEPALDLPLESLAKDALESLKDSVQPNRPDQFVSKLNALTQALNQQTNVTSRLPLVPGQPVAMHQGGWSEAVVDRVMWLSSQNLKSAEIQLDPAELGRLEVRVNLSQDQAQVTFASPNASVREALEGQMHRLRELFTQQGMSLADANVSDQSLSRGWQGQGEEGRGGGGRGGEGLLGGDDAAMVGHQEVAGERLRTGLGLVDYYA
ncbi:flagellar hook-length control protein FliK [Ectopseudomonas hydrolytica]|jgi:flagellar hook-length control protein FliK|uniref:Flagellar hook-length control protein FliK n=1 Tax=Ectopseudomonas hydrolytica TaxID=2493633 RepID=A0ABY5A278_9GAMM|nr:MULTISPECIES: flagellar hook-length control protein FliK [Pseudomonas]MDH0095345.1 flagellar hook-length control protein FliK [Pseudomonas sp. GD04158]USR37973.1 flagellar hook-length control protein FliK [Pseudomonas hydrolytica]